MQSICPPSGSCAFATGDLNVVIQKSTDHGRTWGPMVHVSPGFPASGGDSGPMVVEPGRPGNRHTVMLSWGSAVGGSANSEIFAAPVSAVAR